MARRKPGEPKERKTRAKANGEGSVFQRSKDGKWVATLTTGWDMDESGKAKRRTISKAFKFKAEADKWLSEQKVNRANGTFVEPSRETIGTFVPRWMQTTLAQEVGPSTMRIYQNCYNWYILKNLAHERLQHLAQKPEILQQFVADLRSGKLSTKPLAARTVQLTMTVLRRSFASAVQWNIIHRNPLDAVKPPKVIKKEMLVLSDSQIAQFIDAARTERLHALFTLAVTFALREGELIALRWKDIDLKAGTVTIRETRKTVLDADGKESWEFGAPKTDAGKRSIPIADVAVDALRRWHAEQAAEYLARGQGKQKPTDLVFDTLQNTPLHPRSVRGRAFRRLMEAVGMTVRVDRNKVAKDGTRTKAKPLLRFHDLRHTAATFMLSHGVPPEVVQKIMGHTDITTTLRIYRHVFEHEKKEAAQKVDDFLKTARTQKAR